MTESSLLARTLWSLRSVEAVVSLLSASEIFLLLSSWSERSSEYLRNCSNLSPSNDSNTGLEKSSNWRLEKIPKFTLQRSFWKLSLKLGWVCSASKLSYGWTIQPAVLDLGVMRGQEQSRAGHNSMSAGVHETHLAEALPNPNFHRRQKSLEAMGYVKYCKKITLIQ